MKYYLIILNILIASTVFAQTKATPIVSKRQALLNYVEELKRDTDFKDASWSLMVVNITNQRTVASYREGANLIPASILKLVTTGVGVITLGDKFKYTTQLAYEGEITLDSTLRGNLYIIGGGDPTLGSKEFENTLPDTLFRYFYNSLKKAGIANIDGRIIADASLFENATTNDTWEWGDMGTYYGAGTSALSFCENTFTIPLWSGNLVNDSVKLGAPTPLLPGAVFRNEVRTAPSQTRKKISVYTSPFSTEYIIKGDLPMGVNGTIQDGSILNPASVCASNFQLFLKQHNVNISQPHTVKFDTTAIQPTLIATWQSPLYSDIATYTNKVSNNTFAETILKSLVIGDNQKQITYQQGVDKLVSQLKEMGLNTSKLKLSDGSGLSRQNLISTGFMCSYLQVMQKKYATFNELLPAPGTGTLTNFMRSYASAKTKVRLKSGSMTGVLNYAGYVKNAKGETQCLAVMVNNVTCKLSQIHPKLEKLIYLVSQCDY